MIAPKQAKSARKLLGWSQLVLASKAEISAKTIAKFEAGQPINYRKINAIQNALQAAGVEFVNGSLVSVRMKAAVASQSR